MTVEISSNTSILGGLEFKVDWDVLDLDKTFDCGQCFRWYKVNNVWHGVVGDKFLMISKCRKDNWYDYFATNIGVSEIESLVDYLGLNIDYSPILKVETKSVFEFNCIKHGWGIRILHQDIWETVVSFIISQRNNVPKIKSTIDKLCKSIGKCHEYRHLNGRSFKYYEFPSPREILNAGVDRLAECGLGYRAEYVYEAAKSFNNERFYDKAIKMLSDGTAMYDISDFYQRMYGIGPKVANCITLFAYNKLDIYPVDVWISRVIKEHYGGFIDTRRFNGLAGLMQQYQFFYAKN